MPKQLREGNSTYIKDDNGNVIFPLSLMRNIYNEEGLNIAEIIKKLEIKINEIKELVTLNSTGGTVISESFSDNMIEVEFPDIYKDILSIKSDLDLKALNSDLEALNNIVNTLKAKLPIYKSSNPSGNETDISIGQLFINTDSGDSFICTSIAPLTWTPIVNKVPRYIVLNNQDPTNKETDAFVGQLYINYKDSKYFICTNISLGLQTWTEILNDLLTFETVSNEIITINI